MINLQDLIVDACLTRGSGQRSSKGVLERIAWHAAPVLLRVPSLAKRVLVGSSSAPVGYADAARFYGRAPNPTMYAAIQHFVHIINEAWGCAGWELFLQRYQAYVYDSLDEACDVAGIKKIGSKYKTVMFRGLEAMPGCVKAYAEVKSGGDLGTTVVFMVREDVPCKC